MRRALRIGAGGWLVAAILAAGASPESTGAERYDADLASSRVTVKGTSTIHDWTAEGRIIRGELVLHEIEPSSLWTNSDAAPQALAATVHVEIPVGSLKSDNSGLNRRMYEALKTAAHPMITYRLESAKVATRQTAQADEAGGSLTIETTGVLMVASVERRMDIPMQVKRLPDDRLEVNGETSLRMTEFGIDPPRAMLGMLRTGDTVHVHWTWVLVRRPS